MLKKLRLKFIAINMTIVTLMLITIFALLYFSTASNLERESLRMMDAVAMDHRQMGVPGKQHGAPGRGREDVHLPYFNIMLNHEGEIEEVSGSFYELTDEAQLQELLEDTLQANTDVGVLREYNLRFLVRETPMGKSVVYADITSEQSTLQNLIWNFLIIGTAAFLVFLGISVFLARWAVKPVEQAWQQQKQFVADASHELKTPLTVIMTDAELLQAGECPEEDREPLREGILAMSKQMRGLVESLLELARIDNGSVKEEFSQVSLSEAVSNAVMVFEPVFFEKQLSLDYEVGSDIRVSGIPAHLSQLVTILLDNAGKYSLPGGQTAVKLERCGSRRCLLEVANQGEPISPEDQENVFKRFYRVDKARAMNHSYGLGLSIAQSIVLEHHGRIRCESRDGWNRFLVELPCQEAA